ncbi:MAG TPA: hypothetical protein VE153_26765 [Myxococcus sp.]|nr:hypothetical protein [Myxococcus sp.]
MRRHVRKLAVAVSLGVVVAGGALAQETARAKPKCVKVNGTLTSALSTGACASPVGICTTGEFKGDGLLNGPISFTADSVGPASPAEAPTTLVYSGVLTIQAKQGTLTIRDTGIFDTANGLVAARDLVLGGTGIFEGATGYILFNGRGTTSFVHEASGEICLQR